MSMMSDKYIIFTGGGSGGHVVSALALIARLQEGPDKYHIEYIGSTNGIEKKLVADMGIPYHCISTGKLRRYFSLENFKDAFCVLKGIYDAFKVLRQFSSKKLLIFSMGGFVSVPVVIAGWLLGRKVYIHEQTSRIGLANKIASFMAQKIFLTFESSKIFFPPHKSFVSGYPLRKGCFNPTTDSHIFMDVDLSAVSRPILLITGGGNGSLLLNEKIADSLGELQEKYFIIHQVGKDFEDKYQLFASKYYYPVGLINNIIPLYRIATAIISRAGAGTVSELIALRKKSLFVPLKGAQKNEQYHNAVEAQKLLDSKVLLEDRFKKADLMTELEYFDNPSSDIPESVVKDGAEIIRKEIYNSFT